jgi:hypothetical protein
MSVGQRATTPDDRSRLREQHRRRTPPARLDAAETPSTDPHL